MRGREWAAGADWARLPSAAGQPVFLDPVAVGLEQDLGAAVLPDLVGGALDHAVALAGLLEQHFSGRGDLEALLGAGFRLELGHLALLVYRRAPALAPAPPPPDGAPRFTPATANPW